MCRCRKMFALLSLFVYLSRLGVFQYIRDILQFTVSLDHPVVQHYNVQHTLCTVKLYNITQYSALHCTILQCNARHFTPPTQL